MAQGTSVNGIAGATNARTKLLTRNTGVSGFVGTPQVASQQKTRRMGGLFGVLTLAWDAMFFLFGAERGTRTLTVSLQTDFESAASTGSAISAWGHALCGNQCTRSRPNWRSVRWYQSSPSGLNTAHWVMRPE